MVRLTVNQINHQKIKVMEKKYVMQIAQTIKEQLVSLTPMSILMSWDITDGNSNVIAP